MTTVSIIICTYNRQQLLTNCLGSLVAQMEPFIDRTEVIVVDNNSKDGTAELVGTYCARYSWLRYVRESQQGLSHARNRGATAAIGSYLCFLDDDAKPSPAYLASIHQVIEEHRPDIFGGPVYPYYTAPKPAWFHDSLEIRRHAPTTGFSNGRISGGNFVIRAPLLRELGMFSPKLGMVGKRVRLGEERAILERYRSLVPRAEQRVFYSLECFIYHHVPPAKMRVWYFIKRGYFSGKATVVIKHEHPRNVPPLLRKLLRAWFLEIPHRLRTGTSGSEHPVLALQRGALLAGKIAQHLENVVSHVGTEAAQLIKRHARTARTWRPGVWRPRSRGRLGASHGTPGPAGPTASLLASQELGGPGSREPVVAIPRCLAGTTVDGMIWPGTQNKRHEAAPSVTPFKTRGRDRARVLIATSLGGYAHAQALDAALATALRLRGSDVRLLLCDAVLPACQMSKLGRVTAEALASTGQAAYCARCFGEGSAHFRGLPVVTYGEFLANGDRETAARIADGLPIEQIRGFRFCELAVGEHAYAGALRFFARGDLDGEPHGAAVLRRYLQAGLLTIMALDRLFQRHPTDVVVAHHGIYIPQGMIVEVARSRGIRVVTWNPAYRKHSFIFSHDDTYHHTMMSEPTRAWEDLPLIDDVRRHTLQYLDSRRSGTNDWIWFHDQPREDADRVLAEIGARPDRPYLALLTSVVWDAQLHYASNAFPTMLDWVRETVLYFRRRPDLQLIIRVHPAEVRGLVPSRQRIADEVARWFPALPANVFVIGPEHQASTYALTDHANAIAIYNTKTGVELAAQGRRVIVAGEAWIRGKGFSIDVSTPEHYFQVLDRLPFRDGMSQPEIDRAIRYAYHFFFRRMIPLPFVASTGPASFAVTATDAQLGPGTFRGLDVICDGILTGSPFVYPSESLEDPLAERHEQAVS